jgi:hypothetical protein
MLAPPAWNNRPAWIGRCPASEYNYILELKSGRPGGMLSLVDLDLGNRHRKTGYFMIGDAPATLPLNSLLKDNLMLNKDAIHAIILQALKNINDERGPEGQLTVDLDTRLFGAGAVLDSLSLVSVIVDVEGAVFEQAGRDISLTDDRAMCQEVSPFTDVNALTAYIELLLSEQV